MNSWVCSPTPCLKIHRSSLARLFLSVVKDLRNGLTYVLPSYPTARCIKGIPIANDPSRDNSPPRNQYRAGCIGPCMHPDYIDSIPLLEYCLQHSIRNPSTRSDLLASHSNNGHHHSIPGSSCRLQHRSVRRTPVVHCSPMVRTLDWLLRNSN